VAVDPLPITTELWIVLRQQEEAGVHPSPEVVEHLLVAVARLHFPVRSDRPVVDQSDVGDRWQVFFGLKVSHIRRF
jgi:hypothetical protein